MSDRHANSPPTWAGSAGGATAGAPAPTLREEAKDLLVLRLEERLAEVERTLLLVLEARLRDPRIGAAARKLASGSRAAALEMLDALLPRALAARVLDALEDAPLDVRAARAQDALRAAPPGTSDATDQELAGNDPLARQLLVHAVGATGRHRHRDAIRAAARAGLSGADALDPLRILRRIHEPEEDEDVPTKVEAMVLLRGVPLLAALPPSQLGALAAAARWETHAPGDTVETGDALLVVHAGRLESGARFLGELALFGRADAPAATAAEKTRLLRLAREDLERAVADDPELGLSLCRALAARVSGA